MRAQESWGYCPHCERCFSFVRSDNGDSPGCPACMRGPTMLATDFESPRRR